ncbi:hypothetical protein U8C31_18240 [Sinorhizobium medicae]|uniref:hypothetical protein n=1 Tax=Sinorhizobium medicae TaxID=110321 RepID=UPI002AF6B1E1|nr:hypothetical protein [Sinorhizobium medicae]WQO72177.1 hypothetical protein U8C31_18240 [Sinorhizobium medicae]
MTQPNVDASPRYLIVLQRKQLIQNLICKLARCDGPDALIRAHKAVQWLAAQDEDHATIANGRGFSKSDSTSGRNLAKWSTERVIRSMRLAPKAVQLARKYRRQLPSEYLVDKPKQSTFKI